MTNMKRTRLALSLSQSQMAAKLGMSKRSIQRMEMDPSAPNAQPITERTQQLLERYLKEAGYD